MQPRKLRRSGFTQVCLFLIALVSVVGVTVAMAQVTGSIRGRVADPSGARIPGAAVTVTSLETGVARTVTADEAGNYRVLSLPVGRYAVRAEKTGFKAEVQTGIDLVVGQEAVLNLKLEMGAVQEQVTVTADVPLVNTTTSSVAGLVGERQVKELPLNGRSFDLLITLNAGAVNFTSMRNPGSLQGGNLFTVAGRRVVDNLTLMNGVEFTGASNVTTTPSTASGQLLGIDAVREYNVVADTYGAEYGKRPGAQVSVVTQSGTNQLHGTLFEFLRNSKLDARNFFDHGPVPPFKRNQFGGALGGPIRKDKTFLFGNYEGFRQRLGISDVTFVPDMNARQGLLPCSSTGVPACAPGVAVGTPTPVPNLSPGMLPFLNNLWPEPNGPNLGGGIAIAYSNPAQAIRQDFGTVRFDQTLSGRDSLSGVYTIDDGLNVTPATNPIFGSTTPIRSQIVSLQETRIFSSQVINTFTAGFSRAFFHFVSSTLNPVPASLSFVTGNPPGAISIGSTSNVTSSPITGVGQANPNILFRRNLFTYTDGLQVVKGKHQISAGAWFQRVRSNDSDPSQSYGQATFANIATMLQGTVSSFGVAPQTVEMGWRAWLGAWYVQDSIQLRPNLTIRVGLRHEFSTAWSEVNGRASSFLFNQGVIQTEPRVSGTFNTPNNSKLLFSPRIGVAWDLFGNGKTSIRASAGTYYNVVDELFYLEDSANPFNGAVSFANVPILSLIPVNPLTPVPPVCAPGVPSPCTTYRPRGTDPAFKVPTIESWNFSVEQQLTRDMALRVEYTGFQGYHQFISYDPNTILSQTCSNPAGCVSGGLNAARGAVSQGAQYIPVGQRPNPYLSSGYFVHSEGNQNYNGLQLELKRRLTQGLRFQANYTWSKNMDINTTGISSFISNNEPNDVMDPSNLHRDWGPAAMDKRHQFSANFSYEIPFGQGKSLLNGLGGAGDKLVSGWQVNAIGTVLGGFTFSPLIGANYSGNGDLNTPDRPSLNPAFTGPVILGSPNRWYNPNAFTLPVPGTFGNVGKGTLPTPGMGSLDFSVLKNTRISERIGLQFRAECFNILNRANFSIPVVTAFSGATTNPSAGIISNTTTTSRQIMFGLKLNF
jgi:carboxypeptidase family protein